MIVGEIGLCKCAKNARGAKEERERGLAQQRAVFDAQLKLASRLGRPASVHAVKQHAPLKAALGAVEATPGFAVALHSFSGTAHHVRELLALVDYPLFFGFSHTINVAMNGRRGLAALTELERIGRTRPAPDASGAKDGADGARMHSAHRVFCQGSD